MDLLLVVSAYSRGVHVQMGDLTILSDSPKEIIRRIKNLESEPSGYDRLRLAALRKVMSESTYQDRLAYIVAKVCDVKLPSLFPTVYVVAHVETEEQVKTVYVNYARQNYARKHLLLIGENAPQSFRIEEAVHVCNDEQAASVLRELPEHTWVAYFAQEDFYGANYLTDIILATRYTKADVIGKATFYSFAEGKIKLKGMSSYSRIKQISARCAAVASSVLKKKELFTIDKDTELYSEHIFSVDRFNYLKNGENASIEEIALICDKKNINVGISVTKMQEYAEIAKPLQQENSNIPALDKKLLFDEFTTKPTSSFIKFLFTQEENLQINSTLPHDKHEYIYGKSLFLIKKIAQKNNIINIYIETSHDIDLEIFAIFYDYKKKKLNNFRFRSNTNVEIPINDNVSFIQFPELPILYHSISTLPATPQSIFI